MTNDKNIDLGDELEPQDEEEFAQPDNSNRARNRTVMLTPEITGQVRKMLQDEVKGPRPSSALDSALSAPGVGGKIGSSYSPAGGAASRGFEPPTPMAAPPQFAAPQFVPQPKPQPARVTPIVGFLVSYDDDANGEVFELRSGRWIVSSEQTTAGNFILVHHQSVSPLHAIIRVSAAGEIQVLDQLSEFGTGITKCGSEEEEALAGSMSSVEHGDVLRFGERKFHVCLIHKEA